MSLLKAQFHHRGMTLISRIFGFVRDMMLSRILGAGAVARCLADCLSIYPIFSADYSQKERFQSAFVPLFNRKMAAKMARKMLNNLPTETLSVFVPILLGVHRIELVIMPAVIWVGDEFGQGARTNSICPFRSARITFPYFVLISSWRSLTGILNAIGRFAAGCFCARIVQSWMIGAM